jgi:hypothetical protein
MQPFFGIDLLHAAGDLGGYRGTPPWGDIAAGIEQGFRTSLTNGTRRCYLYQGSLAAKGEDQTGNDDEYSQHG